MITSTVHNAAKATLAALAPRTDEDEVELYSRLGIGFCSMSNLVTELVDDLCNRPQETYEDNLGVMGTQAYLLGVLSERFANKLDEGDPKVKDAIVQASRATITPEQATHNLVADLADLLYHDHGIYMEDGTPGDKVIQTMIDKLSEINDPRGQGLIENLSAILTGVEQVTSAETVAGSD